jgi:hypothetical protein
MIALICARVTPLPNLGRKELLKARVFFDLLLAHALLALFQ